MIEALVTNGVTVLVMVFIVAFVWYWMKGDK